MCVYVCSGLSVVMTGVCFFSLGFWRGAGPGYNSVKQQQQKPLSVTLAACLVVVVVVVKQQRVVVAGCLVCRLLH